jgi:hypothetical protein
MSCSVQHGGADRDLSNVYGLNWFVPPTMSSPLDARATSLEVGDVATSGGAMYSLDGSICICLCVPLSASSSPCSASAPFLSSSATIFTSLFRSSSMSASSSLGCFLGILLLLGCASVTGLDCVDCAFASAVPKALLQVLFFGYLAYCLSSSVLFGRGPCSVWLKPNFVRFFKCARKHRVRVVLPVVSSRHFHVVRSEACAGKKWEVVWGRTRLEYVFNQNRLLTFLLGLGILYEGYPAGVSREKGVGGSGQRWRRCS